MLTLTSTVAEAAWFLPFHKEKEQILIFNLKFTKICNRHLNCFPCQSPQYSPIKCLVYFSPSCWMFSSEPLEHFVTTEITLALLLVSWYSVCALFSLCHCSLHIHPLRMSHFYACSMQAPSLGNVLNSDSGQNHRRKNVRVPDRRNTYVHILNFNWWKIKNTPLIECIHSQPVVSECMSGKSLSGPFLFKTLSMFGTG